MLKKIKNLVKNLKRLANLNVNDINDLKKEISSLKNTNAINELKKEVGLLKDKNNWQKNVNWDLLLALNELLPAPKILSYSDTIDKIINENISICRYGDGELNLMNQTGGCVFQKPDTKLALRLKEVFNSNNPKIAIGINICYFDLASLESFPDFALEYHKVYQVANFRRIRKVVDYNKTYISAEITQLYQISLANFNYNEYFKHISMIWQDKDITIICGGEDEEHNIFEKLEYNIFTDYAKSVEYQFAPRKNAFDEYDTILNKAKSINKNRLVIVILGPTAKVLAYDLANAGYQALDLGHINKDYDSFMKKEDVINDRNKTFFLAD